MEIDNNTLQKLKSIEIQSREDKSLECNNKLKEIYGEEHSYFSHTFKGKFSAGDFVLIKRLERENYYSEYSYRWSSYGETYATDKEVAGAVFLITEVSSTVNENGEVVNLYDLSGYKYEKDRDYLNSYSSAWFKRCPEDKLIPIDGLEVHPFEVTYISPYNFGEELWIPSNGNLFNSFMPNKVHIVDFVFHMSGSGRIENANSWKGLHHVLCSSCFQYGYEEYDAYDCEYKAQWSKRNFIANRYSERRNPKTHEYTVTTVQNAFNIEELKEEVTPETYSHFNPENWYSIFDKKRCECLIRDLGFSSVKEFCNAIVVKEEKPKKKKSSSSTSKKTNKKSEVQTMFENMTDEQKAEMLKLLNK